MFENACNASATSANWVAIFDLSFLGISGHQDVAHAMAWNPRVQMLHGKAGDPISEGCQSIWQVHAHHIPYLTDTGMVSCNADLTVADGMQDLTSFASEIHSKACTQHSKSARIIQQLKQAGTTADSLEGITVSFESGFNAVQTAYNNVVHASMGKSRVRKCCSP